MKELFQSVIWPAVAGNVAWALFSVAVLEWNKTPVFFCERLALLTVVAIYLCLDWTHTQSMSGQLRKFYWVADLFLASAIAALAIAAQTPAGKNGKCYLLAVFAVAAIAQGCDAWVPQGRKRGWYERGHWIAIYVIAGAIAWVFGAPGNEWGLHLPFAASLVVACWALARFTKVKFVDGFRD